MFRKKLKDKMILDERGQSVNAGLKRREDWKE